MLFQDWNIYDALDCDIQQTNDRQKKMYVVYIKMMIIELVN